MAFSTFNWEPQLISLAQKALDSYTPDDRHPAQDRASLEDAYHSAALLTQYHSKTFSLASSLLPVAKRRAVRALYAFCRVSDDLVDCNVEDALAKLQFWRDLTLGQRPTAQDAVAMAWDDARRNYKIPWLYAEQLINGVAQDLRQTRYQTFEELAGYCYGVACTVGLMSMHIIGFSGEAAVPYAIRLGVALQMTNILRDVGEDWRNGRIYLPLQELDDFGLDEQDIYNGIVDDRWRGFMRFQIERTRQLYSGAVPGINLLDRDGRLAIAAAAELYQAILHEIEKQDYDVFSHRAAVSRLGKIGRLPGIWWRVNTRNNHSQNSAPSAIS